MESIDDPVVENLKTAEEPDRQIPWHLWALLIFVLLGTVAVCVGISRQDTSKDLNEVARATIWTTYTIGNPATVHFANMRYSTYSENILCGRINYEQADNKGWSGFTDFFTEKGVMYIAPPAGRFAKKFSDYCLVLPAST